ncbi:hypothetical protein OHA71_06025 [Streptomyces sp. NBC_00444]|uniref:hypothetical protein n=1 Tax=Streptomyces sp. NBC_00444 TaxID=2975744 RepID=UPI002E1CC087
MAQEGATWHGLACHAPCCANRQQTSLSCLSETARLSFVEQDQHEAAAALVADDDRRQFADPARRRELACPDERDGFRAAVESRVRRYDLMALEAQSRVRLIKAIQDLFSKPPTAARWSTSHADPIPRRQSDTRHRSSEFQTRMPDIAQIVVCK